jgi:hypothetical protein
VTIAYDQAVRIFTALLFAVIFFTSSIEVDYYRSKKNKHAYFFLRFLYTEIPAMLQILTFIAFVQILFKSTNPINPVTLLIMLLAVRYLHERSVTYLKNCKVNLNSYAWLSMEVAFIILLILPISAALTLIYSHFYHP